MYGSMSGGFEWLRNSVRPEFHMPPPCGSTKGPRLSSTSEGAIFYAEADVRAGGWDGRCDVAPPPQHTLAAMYSSCVPGRVVFVQTSPMPHVHRTLM
jgi:hypothetical protein